MFPPKTITAPAGVDLAGAFALGNWLWLAKLSHAPEGVSVSAFLLVMALAWLGVIWTWLWLGRTAVEPRALLRRLWLWAVLFRLAGFVAEPVLENDYFRYLWDGRQFAQTGNPYASAPIDHFGAADLPVGFQQILDNINFPEVPTIYGPLSEVAFLISYWIAPGQLWPLKLFLLFADLLTIRLLLALTALRNVFLYAWCPLLIKETLFTAHADTLGILFLVAALHAFIRGRFARLAVLSGLAVGAKIFAALLVPFLLGRVGWKYRALFGATLGALYLPFWLQGSAADLAALTAFVQQWEFNSSVYALLAWLTGATAGKLVCGSLFAFGWGAYFLYWRTRTAIELRNETENRTRVFSLSSLSGEERVGERRAVALRDCPSPRSSPHSFLAGRGRRKRSNKSLNSMAVGRTRNSDALPRGDWIYGLFFLLSATVNPWYLLWLLPFVATSPTVTGVTSLVAVSLAYASGFNLGGTALLSHHPAWVRPVEYGAILIALVIDWRRGRCRAAPAVAAFQPAAEAVGEPSFSFLERTMVLIPALNEADCIGQTVACWQHLSASVVRVVDNGSTDFTAKSAEAAGAEVVSESQRGYGAAAWRGIQEIPREIDWVLFSSADGSDRLTVAELATWQRHVDEGFELILGDRVGTRVARQNLKPVQCLGNRLCCFLISLGWGRRFNDLGSLRLIRRTALEELRMEDRGFGWNVEMQVRALEHRLHVVELPVEYYPRQAGRSKISGSLAGTLWAGRDMLRILARLWITRRDSVQKRRIYGA